MLLASEDIKQKQNERTNELLQSLGEIKKRDVSWILTKKLDAFAGPGEIKRREVVLDPQVSPE